jgi:tetratricopeptide (TPR) repeat protein
MRDLIRSAEAPGRRVLRVAMKSLAVIVVATPSVQGQAGSTAHHGLGAVDFAISCSSQARTEFNEAVTLLHHMTYPQARAGFERIVKTDPQCAMAHWGIAMTLFQPLWPTRPSPQALQRGWDEVQKAKELKPSTDREQLFVDAAEAFYLEPSSADYWLRIRRWEAAMEKAHHAFPNDIEVSAFYALAHLATARSDTISRANADHAASVLVAQLDRHPNHPGVMHYLVHANDVPTRERESLENTRRYDAVAPRNAHALHMPTHIYTRLGDWDGVVRGNIRAAAAALETPAGDRGELVWDEYPHAVEYLVYGYLQQAADDSAAAWVRRVRSTGNLEPTFKTAFHLVSTQARYALERRDWNAAEQVVPRTPVSLAWDRFWWPEAIAQFTRGLGAAHLGKAADAGAASARLDTLERTTREAKEELFARNIKVLRLELDAWRAHLDGAAERSVALLREAVDLEVATPKHPVTPGPTIPALELLGDLLLEQKKPADALVAYQGALARYPNLFNSLLGAARAARAARDPAQARKYYEQLLKLADGGGRQPIRAEARAFIRR